MANRVDQLALTVNLRDIALPYSMNLYDEAPVLVDLHFVPKPFIRFYSILILKFHPGQ